MVPQRHTMGIVPPQSALHARAKAWACTAADKAVSTPRKSTVRGIHKVPEDSWLIVAAISG